MTATRTGVGMLRSLARAHTQARTSANTGRFSWTRVRLDDGLRRDRNAAAGTGPQAGSALGCGCAHIRACTRAQRARTGPARRRRGAGARERAARPLGGPFDRARGARGHARAHDRGLRGHRRHLLPDRRRRRGRAGARARRARGAGRPGGRPRPLPPAQRAGRRLPQLRPGRPRARLLRGSTRVRRPPAGRDAALGAQHEHRVRLPRDPRPARPRRPPPRPRPGDRGGRADRTRLGTADARARAERAR